MGILDKILGAVKGTASDGAGLSSAQRDQLKGAFEPLGEAGGELPARALAFVADGAQESVLIDLQAAQAREPGLLLGEPGSLRYHTGRRLNGGKDLEKRISQAAKLRAAFYKGIPVEGPPLAALVRLGKLFAAADAGQSLDRPGAPVPDWLQYLVNDAVFRSFDTYHLDEHADKLRPAWTIELIAQLLAVEGLDPTLALTMVFERKGLLSYCHRHLQILVQPAVVAEFMRAHREASEALPGRLSAEGRLVLAQRLGSDKALLNDFDALFVRLAVDASKTVRVQATPHLEGIEATRRQALLGALLEQGSPTERTQAADLLARLAGGQVRALLDGALARETSKSVQQVIRSALTRLDAAGDATAVELPEPPPWQPFAEVPLGDEALVVLKASLEEVTERARQAAEKEIEENKARKRSYTWAQQAHERLREHGEADLRRILQVLNGEPLGKKESEMARSLTQVVTHGNKLMSLPSFGPMHLIRWLWLVSSWRSFWCDNAFHQWLRRQPPGSVDLRALAELVQRSKRDIVEVASAALQPYWSTPGAADVLPPECVWPFFAEHPEFIDEGLGLAAPPHPRDRWRDFQLDATLRTLQTFPVVQARWLPRVMELALGEGKTHRAAAQKALSRLPDLGRRVAESLGHSKGEVRIEAARWLADLHDASAIPALTRALDKETRETVRAALLTALEALGDDISQRLAPATLLAEAKKGLKAKPPAGLAWFAFEALPACRWQDGGGAVEPEIIRWWVVLACKLKEPGGNALLTRYLGLLDAPSRQALGQCVLQQFIAQDTRHPPLEEGIAYAQAHAPGRWQSYQSSYESAKPEYKVYYEANYRKTQEQVFEECKREKMGEYLGSAIGEKGLLALTAFAPGHVGVTQLQQYMRDHYQRRAQIEAMLAGLAAGNDPVVIQLLLGVSRRYRTASVQETARWLVQEIAQRNQWTQEQLADRTIPTAGLDDTGTLTLTYGERVFTVVLDAAMKPELRNPEGKVVKALPEPRQSDDPALVKEAKSQLSTSKKELKQVIDLQTARLAEAMCVGRVWPVAEWRDYLHAHPIVGRLVQRLVWAETVGEGTQAVQRLFRPTEDGSLIDAQDEEVELTDGATLRLAHASLVDAGTAQAWVRHFKDYKVAPLFPQMTRQPPALAFKDAQGRDVTEIADRRGWVSDSFTLRGAFTKLGYQRAQAEDGGFFYCYTKDYASVGVRVVIEFSGNTLPEENVPAALTVLKFEDARANRWSDCALPLAGVPPVLLAEAYADYLAVAEACAGFDPAWEEKMPW